VPRTGHQRLAQRLDGLGLRRFEEAERHTLRPRLPRRHQHAGAAHREGEHAHARAFEKNAPLHGVHGSLRGVPGARGRARAMGGCSGRVNAKGQVESSGGRDVISRAPYDRSNHMMKILDRAIAKARALSEEDQDALGAVLLSLAEEWSSRPDDLDDETRAAIREGLAQAKRGEFVPEQDIQALWKRYGL